MVMADFRWTVRLIAGKTGVTAPVLPVTVSTALLRVTAVPAGFRAKLVPVASISSLLTLSGKFPFTTIWIELEGAVAAIDGSAQEVKLALQAGGAPAASVTEVG